MALPAALLEHPSDVWLHCRSKVAGAPSDNDGAEWIAHNPSINPKYGVASVRRID